LYKDIAVITQLYYQVYITYQLHVLANAPLAIIMLDTVYQRIYTAIACVVPYLHRFSDITFVISYLYSFSDKLYPTWWCPQQHWPKHVVDKLYTPDNIVVLWLLYPYRIINVGSNKHNRDGTTWSMHVLNGRVSIELWELKMYLNS